MILSNIKVFKQRMYDILNTTVVKPRGKYKWAFEISDKQWIYIYFRPFLVLQDSKLRWFQFRINNHILTTVTISLMYKIVIIETNICTFCKEEEETIYYLIWECSIVQRFLETN